MDKFEKQKRQEESRKRNREIQAAFRRRHRDRIDDVNTVHRILIRQKQYLGDGVDVLAAALRRLMGQAYVEELRTELAAPVVAGGKTRTTAETSKEASTTRVALDTPFEACITLFRAPVKDAAAEMLRYNTSDAVEIAKAILAKFATFPPRDTAASSSPASVSAGGKNRTTAKTTGLTSDDKPKRSRRTKGLTVRQQDAVLHAARKMPDLVKGILSGADTSGKSDWT